MLLMALGLVETGNSDEAPMNQTFPEDTQKVLTTVDGDGASQHQDGSPDLIWSFVSKHLGQLIAGQCNSTYSLQPLFYHIGCAFFLLAFLAPSHRRGAALFMRCMLICGCILFAMWSYLTECRPDVLMWSAIFIVANLIHLIILICQLRPVKFDKEIEEVSFLNVMTFEFAASEMSCIGFCSVMSRAEAQAKLFPPQCREDEVYGWKIMWKRSRKQ